MKKHVFVAIPTHTGQMWVPLFQSFLRSIPSMMNAGWHITPDSVMFDYTESARGKLVAQFLATDATHLLFLDYDNFWSGSGDVVRLLEHDVDVVGADYPRKRFPINYLSRLIDGSTKREANGLIKVEAVPAGMLRISRRAILKLASVYPPNADGEYEFFDRLKFEGHKLGDDYSFCQRWRDLGETVWLDPEIKVAHIGPLMFDADIKEWLKAHDDAALHPSD